MVDMPYNAGYMILLNHLSLCVYARIALMKLSEYWIMNYDG